MGPWDACLKNGRTCKGQLEDTKTRIPNENQHLLNTIQKFPKRDVMNTELVFSQISNATCNRKKNMIDALTTANSRPTFGNFIKDTLTGMLHSWKVTAIHRLCEYSSHQDLPGVAPCRC